MQFSIQHLEQDENCTPPYSSFSFSRQGSILFAMLMSLIVLSAPVIAQEESSIASETLYVRQITLKANGLAYDPRTKKLFASLPSSYGPDGNSVVEIDPITGTMGKPLFVGSEPTVVAISKDGKYLYTILSGARSIARVNLVSHKVDTIFAGPPTPVGLVVFPKNSAWIAVVRHATGSSGYEDVVLYENGVERPGQFGKHAAPTVIAMNDDGTRMYAYTGWVSSYGFDRWVLDRYGWSTGGGNTGSLINGYNLGITYAGGRIYVSNGQVVDPEKFVPLGRFEGAGGLVFPDIKLHRIVYINKIPTDYNRPNQDLGSVLRVYDPDKFTKSGEITLLKVMGDPQNAVMWGDGHYAFRASDKIVTIGPEISLVAACRARDWTKAQLMILSGVNPNITDEVATTALMWASLGGKQTVVSLLLEKGADPKARDGREDTALGYAVASGNAKVVDILLQKGVDPNLGGALGKPLKIAEDNRSDEIYQMLIQAGAKPDNMPSIPAKSRTQSQKQKKGSNP